jgi:hypothetical protein
VALHRHLQLEEAQLDQGIEVEKNRQDYLEWLKGYVQTDQFVDSLVRREWKLVKPGETSVVLNLPEAPIAPQTSPQEESPPSRESRWREWWGRLFGDG